MQPWGAGGSHPNQASLVHRTHCDLGAPGPLPVEAEHDDLQAVAAVRALEQARPDEVVRAAGREVDAPVGQAVAAGRAVGMRAGRPEGVGGPFQASTGSRAPAPRSGVPSGGGEGGIVRRTESTQKAAGAATFQAQTGPATTIQTQSCTEARRGDGA